MAGPRLQAPTGRRADAGRCAATGAAGLADEVLAHGRAMAAALGVCTPPVLDAILEAAAAAAGTSVDAVRPAVAAAFERAAEAGVNVNAVVAALGED